MNEPTIHIPIHATYRIIDGKAVKIDAEYADVPASVIAEMILRGFGLSSNLVTEGTTP